MFKDVLRDVVERTASECFMPLTVGGGLRTVEDIRKMLHSGADKVSLNTAAINEPSLILSAARKFGNQCIVLAIDAKRDGSSWRVYTHGGRKPTPLDAIEWAQRAVSLGAGEILLTSIDQDGTRDGYDLEMTARIVEAVSVPVIASGGAGSAEHVRDAFLLAGADAALAAGIFHDGSTTIRAVKRVLADAGIPVREVPPADQRIAAPQ